MLEELKEFRDKLDNLMCSCMDKTIVIYGYDIREDLLRGMQTTIIA